jgi:single-stranded-DNA-specific exonuclease
MKYTLIGNNDISSPLATVLKNRGITEIEHYLHTTDDDILNPLLLDNIAEAAGLMMQHISNGNRIGIQVDCDCDGYTSAAALINFLYMLVPEYTLNNVEWYVHENKVHGISDTIELYKNCDLVIIPDASSNEYELHKELKSEGKDIIVLDHHKADIPDDDPAIIVNNQTCGYPNKTLSGVGIVYKFCSLINQEKADKLLDVVALGLVADMMSLKDFETKRLIVRGLQNIRNPFFKAMVEKNDYSLGGEVTPIGIAFYIAPFVNAVTRVGTLDEKKLLFLSLLDFEGFKKVPSTKRGAKANDTEIVCEQAARVCTNVKNRQNKERDKMTDEVLGQIETENLNDNKILIIQLEKSVDKNLTGLIANRVMSLYQKPTLILNKVKNDNNEIVWSGSGRNYSKNEFDDFRKFLRQSNLTELAEGHPNALGVAIKEEKLQRFIEYSNELLSKIDFSPKYNVDFELSYNNLDKNAILEIADGKDIWGQDVDEPYILIKNVKVNADNLFLMSPDKKPTLKITTPNGVDLIKFGSSEKEYESLKTKGCINMNIIGRCSKNVWLGQISAQVFIEDYEILEKLDYYF